MLEFFIDFTSTYSRLLLGHAPWGKLLLGFLSNDVWQDIILKVRIGQNQNWTLYYSWSLYGNQNTLRMCGTHVRFKNNFKIFYII